MNKQLRRKWLRALRSGSYRRGEGSLVSEDGRKFCCLGVLADIQGCVWQESIRDSSLVPIMPHGRKPLANDGTDFLPVRRTGGLTEDQQSTLAEMNDDGKSFKQIADFIESHF